ncbi:ThuA domain-containing protein [Rubrivirga marina]|uniref:ThuA-like domain-containing protein n=1 Tax=Rubrivirga marina TaxID=1196024 RepID=A0A271IXM9_9BACT|nr:ThuA domain-containing protein [Rubrivirga marina]PAP76011.1 hypothetical protein BSZ37_05925 [Rubrivirga marina]
MTRLLALLLLLGGCAGSGPAEPPRLLVFSKTEGWVHDSIPAAVEAVRQLGEAGGFAVDATQDAAAFSDDRLAEYDAVVFLLTTGDVLDTEQEAAFERFVRAGGGYAGVHSASDTEYEWPFYGDLVGAYFESHPPGTPDAVVDVVAAHPSTEPLPQRWTWTDEWYAFRAQPENVRVLMTVDESTYEGGTMGEHPIAWCHEALGGRAWYTALGHRAEGYADEAFRAHLLGGLRYAAGLADGDCGS